VGFAGCIHICTYYQVCKVAYLAKAHTSASASAQNDIAGGCQQMVIGPGAPVCLSVIAGIAKIAKKEFPSQSDQSFGGIGAVAAAHENQVRGQPCVFPAGWHSWRRRWRSSGEQVNCIQHGQFIG
jgi:hypothetical protein